MPLRLFGLLLLLSGVATAQTAAPAATTPKKEDVGDVSTMKFGEDSNASSTAASSAAQGTTIATPLTVSQPPPATATQTSVQSDQAPSQEAKKDSVASTKTAAPAAPASGTQPPQPLLPKASGFALVFDFQNETVGSALVRVMRGFRYPIVLQGGEGKIVTGRFDGNKAEDVVRLICADAGLEYRMADGCIYVTGPSSGVLTKTTLAEIGNAALVEAVTTKPSDIVPEVKTEGAVVEADHSEADEALPVDVSKTKKGFSIANFFSKDTDVRLLSLAQRRAKLLADRQLLVASRP